MSELDDALDRWDSKRSEHVINRIRSESDDVALFVEAARRVANPDMKAAGDAIIDAGVADLPGIGAIGHILARIAVSVALGVALGITTDDDE